MIFCRIDKISPPWRIDDLERWRHYAGYFSKKKVAISAAFADDGFR
jgi:hypothetical protein